MFPFSSEDLFKYLEFKITDFLLKIRAMIFCIVSMLPKLFKSISVS